MKQRISIAKSEPEAYKAMLGLESYLDQSGLKKTHRELIKIRASQINGCAYCINMHTQDARAYGETEQRIYLLNAWRETNLFTTEERCILAMTEEITRICKGGLSDKTYQQASELFDDHYLSQIIMCIVAINAWNRIGVATQMQPDLNYKKQAVVENRN